MAVFTPTTASQLQSSFVRFDAEFFRPEFTEVFKNVSSIPGINTLGRISERITQGSNPKFAASGQPCVNGKNVYFGTMTEGDPNFVSSSEFERLSGYVLRRNDLVITLKHATKIGRVWIVEDDDPRIFSRNVGLVRLRHDSPIMPSVLLLYLWTKQGQLLLDRCATGGTTGQITLPMSELRRLPIPPISDDVQMEIDTLFWKSRGCTIKSKQSYTQALQLLESELGLDKLKFDKPMGYSARFSDIAGNNRADADFYQVPFIQMHKHLDGRNTVPLSSLAYIFKGIEVGSKAYTDSGKPFLRVSNITEKGIKLGPSDKYISEGAFLSLASSFQPKVGEMLLTKDGTAGTCLVVDEEIEGIISGGIVRLIRKSDSVPLEYIALAINSKACRMQVEQECSGALILHWKPSSIRKLRIPLLSQSKMETIADLVIQSKLAQRKSVQLLDQAKSRVEQLIEEAIQS